MKELIEEHAKRLKLSWIREHYHEVKATSHEEFLLKLFEKEVQQREERKLNLLIKQSSLPDISGRQFDWDGIHMNGDLSKEDVLEGRYITRKENLILYGGVGVGKTLLASLSGWNAIHREQRKVRFYTAAQLVNQLLDANEKGTLGKLYKQIENLDLLILDELGYVPLHKQGAELLFQVFNLCYEKRSVIVTTNLQFGQWNHVFGDPILTEAFIDRLIHYSHLIVFNRESFRHKESLLNR
ncbi:IS21-like element helper ATPase IstB [Sporosarcina saromensis]|uniref:IS21-like element helper ATPase IstB n=1 Tax=Sporosarcina saromensis TaxID=359365 RepID=A0ABU4GED0_9BACL|nr:IS21-like element helper ATPase IstB [Sporosarcina saromensis]MDW0115317.1 IS21-like element helper ATPase IstB [Sporosarcina saromensis]